MKCQRKGSDPVIGSKIIIELVSGRGVYQVLSKKQSSESDFMYCVVKDGKETTLNLNRVTWQLFDGGEKIPMKDTV